MRRIILCCLTCVAAVAASAGSLNWIGDRLWGFSVSYSMKWYTYSSGGSRNRVNYFGEGGPMQGIRFGVPFEPVFYRGIGLSTGIFGEVYSCKNDAETKRIELVGLYFPVHAMYRYRLSRSCALSVATGPALTVGLVQKIIDPTNSLIPGYHVAYDRGTPQRVNCLWEAALIANVKIFRFSVVYSVGLTPNRHFLSTDGAGINYYSTNSQEFSINAGLMF